MHSCCFVANTIISNHYTTKELSKNAKSAVKGLLSR